MEAKIVSIAQGTMIDPASKQTVPAVNVTYKVGDHGPFVETLPKATFNPGEVKQKIAAMVAHVGQLA